MQFTRPGGYHRTDVSVTASTAVAVRLLEALELSEWAEHVVAVSEVPGLSLELSFELGGETLYDVVTADVRLDAWLGATLDRILSDLPDPSS